MKKLLTFLVLLSLLIGVTGSMATAGEMNPLPEQISDTPDYASVRWFNPLKSSDFAISYVESSIKKASSASVTISATTETNETADDIGGMMTIQKWENNKWNDYKNISFYAFDRDTFSASKTVSVDSGFFYRLTVHHSAHQGIESDAVRSTTKSVEVN